MKKISKPEYLEFAQYYENYILQVDQTRSVLDQLKQNSKELAALYLKQDESKLQQPYASDKWSPKDLLMHLIDTERVFLYRGMRFARKDKTPLPFFDENEYTRQAAANNINTRRLIKEYLATRQASIAFFNNLTASQLKNQGIASQFTMSVRACIWIICGHEIHHVRVLKERYGFKD
ncbi:MAG: DinB family protein [Chitinophagaceae bacterium]|nr:DinB family protein [Chitinophagaceae bacterium]